MLKIAEAHAGQPVALLGWDLLGLVVTLEQAKTVLFNAPPRVKIQTCNSKAVGSVNGKVQKQGHCGCGANATKIGTTFQSGSLRNGALLLSQCSRRTPTQGNLATCLGQQC